MRLYFERRHSSSGKDQDQAFSPRRKAGGDMWRIIANLKGEKLQWLTRLDQLMGANDDAVRERERVEAEKARVEEENESEFALQTIGMLACVVWMLRRRKLQWLSVQDWSVKMQAKNFDSDRTDVAERNCTTR